ncbi:hypothetical protein AVEN_219886-1 [Araneus ventricosus]|uniref:Uncharacterized protein n=1 Tax=Araneus ventricosus TaxID=182803 RepID=A0A4Y2QD64_ARAVE|nr:hypothetical protein AVEN_219886-1 [Araneus ventricosus]
MTRQKMSTMTLKRGQKRNSSSAQETLEAFRKFNIVLNLLMNIIPRNDLSSECVKKPLGVVFPKHMWRKNKLKGSKTNKRPSRSGGKNFGIRILEAKGVGRSRKD